MTQASISNHGTIPLPPDISAFVHSDQDHHNRVHFLVQGMHCAACISKIEQACLNMPGVEYARVNFSTRRLEVRWTGRAAHANAIMAHIAGLGYDISPFQMSDLEDADTRHVRQLTLAMAVSGFASMNIMLLSIGLWAGYFDGMDHATRQMLHWFSALIAFPAVLYSGQPFFRSAWQALSHRRTNMDVPISIGVLLACVISFHETLRGGAHIYFDSAIMLVFVLLIGRVLDARVRARARATINQLLAARQQHALIRHNDGSTNLVPVDQVPPGSMFLVAAGERVPLDGQVQDGMSQCDTSLINGESIPRDIGRGDLVYAGTCNLSQPLLIRATREAGQTVLSDIIRYMEAAEQRQGRYQSIADRVIRWYTPIVHILALGCFIGWYSAVGWAEAALHAVTVLIITCPCALGLAVPVVQVIALSSLMRRGVLIKNGQALELLSQVDTIVFDKTGTLTLGTPRLVNAADIPEADLQLAAGLAVHSRHPLARALLAACPNHVAIADVQETAGMGVACQDQNIRLGHRLFCDVAKDIGDTDASELWLIQPNQPPRQFVFADTLRPDAIDFVAALKRLGYRVIMLSGDRPGITARTAAQLGITEAEGNVQPLTKAARIEALQAQGHKILMVGDGLNDAPPLKAADVSLSPATAAEISQNVADGVFQGAHLMPVLACLHIARRGQRLVVQNIILSFGYNVLAVPLALAGMVTPLLAAAVMSVSSLTVVGNAFRLNWPQRNKEPS